MPKSRFGKVVALVLVMSVGIVFSAGCYGKFQLTRSLYEVNKSVEDKYLRSVVTWIFIIPYAITGFLDFVIFNLIEFWSGQNPVVVPQARVYENGDDRVIMTIAREGGATVATVERYHAGSLVSTLRIRDDGAGTVTSELVEDGKVDRTMTAMQEMDGSVSVAEVSSTGTEMKRYSPNAVETHRARLARIAREVGEALAAAGAAPPVAMARVPAMEG
jgi:hypothetical protein